MKVYHVEYKDITSIDTLLEIYKLSEKNIKEIKNTLYKENNYYINLTILQKGFDPTITSGPSSISWDIIAMIKEGPPSLIKEYHSEKIQEEIQEEVPKKNIDEVHQKVQEEVLDNSWTTIPVKKKKKFQK